MTLQEIFDKVRTHLLTQQRMSGDDFRCLYRSSDGLSCAVGCLISDEAYSPAIEGKDVGSTAVVEALRASGLDVDSQIIDFLDDLQAVHDNFPPARWPEKLAEIAAVWGLQ